MHGAGALCASGSDFSRIPCVQAKLRVSTPDQPAEKEADRMAEKFVALDDEPVDFVNPEGRPVKRTKVDTFVLVKL